MPITLRPEPYLVRPVTAGGSPPATNPNAQLVLNKAAKTGFTFWIRLL